MKAGDSDSVRAIVEAIVNFPRVYRMPDIMAAVVKQRLIDAQMVYLDGKTAREFQTVPLLMRSMRWQRHLKRPITEGRVCFRSGSFGATWRN
jgi:hypothetical protein